MSIRIVLVETTHPGNIGATARAMKTMGLAELVLVAPKFFPHADATAMAAGADDILSTARVCESLDEAIADCILVIATSARSRSLPWPMLTPKESAERLVMDAKEKNVALVFGQEKAGLTNEQLARCHYHTQIPSVASFSSLNLAASVQVMAYEMRLAQLQDAPKSEVIEEEPLAIQEDMQGFYLHLQETLLAMEFLRSANRDSMMLRIRRLFNRAQMDKTEVNILRGILSAVQRTMGYNK